MVIKIKKLSENAIIPTRGSEFSAGYDLYSNESYSLAPGERKLFKTNISIKIPNGYYGRIAPRSGLAYKNGIDVLAGVIDEDYIGNIGVILLNTSSGNQAFYHGIKENDRIAQIIFEKYHEAEFEEVENLEESSRADKGFGSTGS